MSLLRRKEKAEEQKEATYTLIEPSAFTEALKNAPSNPITDPERLEANQRRREAAMRRYGLTPEDLEELRALAKK